ncbi:hypothetical protein LguiA_028713 [Lonicera macranthoides]
MEEYTDEVMRPQLLDLIPKEREWLVKRDDGEEARIHKGASEEKKLELRLGLPGEDDDDWTIKLNGTNNSNYRETVTSERNSLLSLGYSSRIIAQNTNPSTCGSKRGFIDTVVDPKRIEEEEEDTWIFNKGLPVAVKESSSQTCCTKVGVDLHSAEKNGFSPASASANNNTAVTLQKRAAPGPVVGWPPIRSFRKNIASTSSSKPPPPPQPQDVIPNKVASQKQAESCRKGLFVKINMDGVPIGRKVDLKFCGSYDKLSSAVDELFRGLLAAQRDCSGGGIKNKQEGEKAITGLLDGSGEYTLVYEDNEGDRMLVGDVPWHMFVSTVKRLRVLKSSEVSALFSGSKQEKKPLDVALK